MTTPVTYDDLSNSSEVGYGFWAATPIIRTFSTAETSCYGIKYYVAHIEEWGCCGFVSKWVVPVYSYDLKCVECSNQDNNVWLYILLAFVPVTVFYFIFLHLQINLVTSPIFGFVLYSQMLANPFFMRALLTSPIDNLYVDYYIRIMTAVFFGVWNLDLFRGFNKTICFEIGSIISSFARLH